MKKMKESEVADSSSGSLDKDDVTLSSFIAKRKGLRKRDGGGGGGGGSTVEKKVFERRKKKKMKSEEANDEVLLVLPSSTEDVECREDNKFSGNEGKRSRMDVFEYNEDDLVDFKRTKRECGDGGGADDNGRSRVLGPRSLEKGGKLDTSCDNKPVRVQGKNGVLKVMIRNKKEVGGGSESSHGHVKAEENANEKTRVLRNRRSIVIEKTKMNPKKASLIQNSKAHDLKSEDSDTSLGLGSTDVEAPISRKKGKVKEDSALPSEVSLSCGYKGSRGANTKKQLLREQIRSMVLKAGWKIDFRLRRGRNYQDAVYTDHAGKEHWSVLNAYNALRKQSQKEEANGEMCSAFTPIPEESLSLLTRRTRKRIERENRMKLKASKRSSKAKETIIKKSPKNKYVTESKNGRRKSNGFVGLKKKVSGKTQKSTRLSNKGGHGNGENMLKKQSSTGRKSKKQNGYALLVRSSNKEEYPDGSGFTPYAGKRTILSWMIDSGAVSLSGKVQYMNKRRTRTLLEGWITRDGIHCGCCSKIVTVSKFEIHAGSKLRQPFQNIYVETGISLFHCQLNAWNSQEESESSGDSFIDISGDDPNDDTCGICGDGGNLICCDGCPSTFHQSCLDIQVLPTGDWHCSNCSCKFCGLSGDNGQGDDVAVSKLHSCNLCEEKYHQFCMHKSVVDTHSSCIPFCGQNCKELFEHLQKLLWVKHELEDGFSWTLIQRSVLDSDKSVQGLSRKAECNSKLAVALTVMDECFFPIIDRRSGINLIRNVVYNCGSNFNRLDYSGFYTAVLERGDEIISAASIRIHGTRLAEMPFIGTRHIYRRQGMCRRLLNAIESALCSLKVEKLIIPAISELVHAWTTVFGFNALEQSHKQEMRSLNMLVFPGTDMLQKIVLKHDSTEGNLTDNSVVEAIKLQSNQQITATITHSSVRLDSGTSNEGVTHQEQQINNKVLVVQATMKDKSEPHSSVRPDTNASDEDAKHQEHLINNEVSGVQADLGAHDSSDVGPWMRSMLAMDFFNPCSNHKDIKKNELKYFCISCVRSICCYCLPAHLAHQYIQIRRYLHHDIINLKDFHMLFDCSSIQTYFTNREKVCFINPRPITAKAKRLSYLRDCGSCGRAMQDSSLYCSIACKVSVMDSKHHNSATDDSKVIHNSNLNDHKTFEMETEPDEVSPVGSNANPEKNIQFSSESIMNDTSEMETEVAAVQPDLYNSEVGCLPCSTSCFTQLHDTSVEENGGSSACHNSENTSQALSNVSKCSFLDSQDSKLVEKIQGCDLDKSLTVPNTCEVDTEVSAMGNNPQALSKDSLDCASEGDREFVSSASRNNCLSSVACVSDELLSYCSKSPSDLALPPVSEAAHDNTSNVAADPCGAVPGHSSHHSSNQDSVLDIGKLDAGFSSVYPNDRAFGEASVCDSLDTASEPTVQVMDGTHGFCKSLEKNDQTSSCKSNTQDVPGLKDEVAAFESNALHENAMHEPSEEPTVQVMDGTHGFCKSLEKNDQTSSCKSNTQDVPGLKDEVAAFESNALHENAMHEPSEEAVKSLGKTA